MSAIDVDKGLKITALALPNAAKVISQMSGKQITEATLMKHIDAGAPVNKDGTLNVITYAAWLAMEVANAN